MDLNALINQLKNIQNDLIGILVPVVITSVVTLLSLLINTIVKIIIVNKKYNMSQFEIMKNVYPKLKMILINIKVILLHIENIKLKASDKSNFKPISDYIEFKNNEGNYRNEHQEQIEYIDNLFNCVEKLFVQFFNLNKFFEETTLPNFPNFHPILKYKTSKMIGFLIYISSIIFQYVNEMIANEIIEKESDKFEVKEKIKKVENSGINSKLFDEYIEILDKWFSKY